MSREEDFIQSQTSNKCMTSVKILDIEPHPLNSVFYHNGLLTSILAPEPLPSSYLLKTSLPDCLLIISSGECHWKDMVHPGSWLITIAWLMTEASHIQLWASVGLPWRCKEQAVAIKGAYLLKPELSQRSTGGCTESVWKSSPVCRHTCRLHISVLVERPFCRNLVFLSCQLSCCKALAIYHNPDVSPLFWEPSTCRAREHFIYSDHI